MKERKVGQGWKYHNSLLLFGFGAVALSVRVVVLDSPKKKKKKRCPTLLWLHSGVLFVSFRPFIIIIFFFFLAARFMAMGFCSDAVGLLVSSL